MRPVKQGDLDALCGVYAVINALEQVGVVGRRSPLHTQLFEKLVLSMTPHQVRGSLMCGLEADDLIGISRRAFRWLRSVHGVDLRMRRPFADREFETASDYVEVLRTQAQDWRRAVIVGFDIPGGSHWTVVRSIEGRRLYVRDSGRMTHLDLNRFDLTRGRYRFLPADTLVILRRE
jgi:hypothetical protein